MKNEPLYWILLDLSLVRVDYVDSEGLLCEAWHRGEKRDLTQEEIDYINEYQPWFVSEWVDMNPHCVKNHA